MRIAFVACLLILKAPMAFAQRGETLQEQSQRSKEKYFARQDSYTHVLTGFFSADEKSLFVKTSDLLFLKVDVLEQKVDRLAIAENLDMTRHSPDGRFIMYMSQTEVFDTATKRKIPVSGFQSVQRGNVVESESIGFGPMGLLTSLPLENVWLLKSIESSEAVRIEPSQGKIRTNYQSVFSPSRRFVLLSSEKDPALRLLDLVKRKELKSPGPTSQWKLPIVFDENETGFVAVAEPSRLVRHYDLRTGKSREIAAPGEAAALNSKLDLLLMKKDFISYVVLSLKSGAQQPVTLQRSASSRVPRSKFLVAIGDHQLELFDLANKTSAGLGRDFGSDVTLGNGIIVHSPSGRWVFHSQGRTLHFVNMSTRSDFVLNY